ncbi:NEL-type E3 ubiquitin ligase domain-containing protein [Pseudomonas sp.]|uniref:NEL-type E3 ubiquitin ligase domain-containing protein n=1 Tax=Pseudomonas sp. TaxID=306 RepID=UPI0026057088|nr:NEL-type E3 ubiquitin ligase domain-containing protein [Pseudomonas sp.]
MTDPHRYPPLDARDSTLSDLEPLELVHSHMPKWLLETSPELITALNESMAQSRAYHRLVGQKFSELEGIEAFCAPLLIAALKGPAGGTLNVFRDRLEVVRVYLSGDSTFLASLKRHSVHEEPKTLLWAALQNFSADEAQAGGFDPQSYIRLMGHPGYASTLRPHQFAALCRQLNLGLKYQQYLQRFLGVAPSGSSRPSAHEEETESNLRLLKRYDMEVDAHIAFAKKQISASAYKALLALVAQHETPRPLAPVELDGKPILLSSLSLLETAIDGVLVFSSDDVLAHPHNRLIVYIPNDPVAPLREFSALQALTDALKTSLSKPEYATFFSRFVPLSTRAVFVQKLNARPEHLGLTATHQRVTAARYLCSVQLHNMFADAQLLAVPTGVLDEREREQRWQRYKAAGLFLVNMASLFVPILGDMMLAVAVADMLAEVYEGVEDWAHGDIDHARGHLLNVARDLATTAAVVTGVAAVKKVASSLGRATQEYAEGFEAIKRDDGTARLWNKQLDHYTYTGSQQHRRHLRDAQGFFHVGGKPHVTVGDKHYAVRWDATRKQWRIPHPRRPDAYQPALLNNQAGAWQHAHERPLEWQGSTTLIGRLGPGFAALDEQTLEQVRQLTDTDNGLMRQVHFENLPPPALLQITLERFAIDRKITRFIDQMGSNRFLSAELVDLQLTLLPELPGWPEGKGLTLVDGAGFNTVEYGNVLWPTTSRIVVTPAQLDQGKVLHTVLEALAPEQVTALLGSRISLSPPPVSALAQRLGAYVSDHRRAVFERLYQRVNVSSAAQAKPVEVAFPGLPRPVAQALATSANDVEREMLGTGKVPLVLAEQARLDLHASRLNRALEGFYLEYQAGADTQLLTRHFLTQLPNWPVSAALELRAGSPQGELIERWGSPAVSPPVIVVQAQQHFERYSRQGTGYKREGQDDLLLSRALFHSLDGVQRKALGIEQAQAFDAALATLAAMNRVEAAKTLGMQPIKPGFKAPMRLTSGKVGYPLCGLDAGRYSRSVQRRVRSLNPEFTDDHVHAYLDSITESGLDPLAYLRTRKRAKKALREALQAWVYAAPDSALPYDYSESRYQATRLIQSCWRKDSTHMPWLSDAHVDQLSLEGLRVGRLPELPETVVFDHVSELNMSNMECKDAFDSFLLHFKGLTRLYLDNNQLTRLPSALRELTYLRSLSLRHNALALTPQDAGLLGALPRLEVLNLNDNPLGPLLDLGNLSFIRRVYLRRTGIDAWPQGLISRPLLEVADLRENQIPEIPALVYEAPALVLRNISLSGNPLSAASRFQLARFTLRGGSSLGINSEALVSEAAAFEYWTLGITNHELSRCEGLWSGLRAEALSSDFFTVISRLTTTSEAQSIRQDLSRRVWEMIEVAYQRQNLRLDLFDLAAAPRTCIDSVLLIFSEMEVQVLLGNLSITAATQESELLHLARRLFRLNKVNDLALEAYALKAAEQPVSGGPLPDDVEVMLAYRIGLAQPLELPGQPKSMTFVQLAGVTQADLDSARLRVEQAELTVALNEFISKTTFWRNYLIQKYQSEFSRKTTTFFTELSDLLRQSPDMTSERYLRRVTEIRNQMDDRIEQWCLEKTREALHPTPPVQPAPLAAPDQ